MRVWVWGRGGPRRQWPVGEGKEAKTLTTLTTPQNLKSLNMTNGEEIQIEKKGVRERSYSPGYSPHSDTHVTHEYAVRSAPRLTFC